VWKYALYFALSIFMSPAVTIRMAWSSTMKDSVFAMRAGSQPAATAASSTVALDTGNSMILLSAFHCFKYLRTDSIAMIVLLFLFKPFFAIAKQINTTYAIVHIQNAQLPDSK
jgi:hypothetical protein